MIDRSRAPFYRWYEGGLLNTCYSAVDRHADGARADQLALIYDSPVTGVIQRFTYRELRDQVARVAGVLRSLGVGKGDRVLIFMPNTPEAVMTMLASARLGAVHSVVFGGFASRELAARIDDARPKVIVWASCGIEPGRIVAYKPLLDGALALASHKPDACVVLQRPAAPAALEPGRDLEWTAAVARRGAGQRMRSGAGNRSALHPVYVGHDGKAEGSRPRQRRLRRRPDLEHDATFTVPNPATSTGPPRISAGPSVTATSSTGRCSAAAQRFFTRASRSAHLMPVRSGA